MARTRQELENQINQLRAQNRQYETWLKAIGENGDFDLWIKDETSTYRFVNEKFVKAMGRSENELLHRRPEEIFEGARCQRVIDLDQKVMEEGQIRRIVPCDASGTLEMHEEHRFVVNDHDGHPVGLGCIAYEVTEKNLASKTLNNAEKLARLGSWRWSAEDNMIISCSEQLAELLKYPITELFDVMPQRITKMVLPDDRHLMKPVRDRMNGKTSGPYELEYRLKRGDRKTIIVREVAEPFIIENGIVKEYIGVMQDISRQKVTELQLKISKEILEKRVEDRTADLKYVAEHDPLTGAYHRNRFHEIIMDDTSLFSQFENVTIICLDLCGFKSINDCFGHDVGDTVLKHVAQRMTQTLGSSGIVARIGGDEFAVAIPCRPDIQNQASTLCHQFRKAIEKPYKVKNYELRLSVKAGHATGSKDLNALKETLKHADIALQKSREKNDVYIRGFRPSMVDEIKLKKSLELEMRDAIRNREITTAYQPQYDIKDGNLVGFEVLARWHHPKHGSIPPTTFIKVAEDCGLINDLGKYILIKGCSDMAKLMRAMGQTFKVSVNISVSQFYNWDLLSSIVRISEHGILDPELLELEITESMYMRHLEQTKDILNKFRDQGIGIALDDFGMGYSSLEYLNRFPVNTIKLDKSFIDNIVGASGNQKLVSGILSLAKNLDLKVVVEGVETVGQLDYFKQGDFQLTLQGFLLGKPVSIDHLMENVDKLSSPPSLKLAS